MESFRAAFRDMVVVDKGFRIYRKYPSGCRQALLVVIDIDQESLVRDWLPVYAERSSVVSDLRLERSILFSF